jgi:DNA modification methylase
VLIQANALQVPLADKSVHCAVTSPPYWGLRDYQTGKWVGGDPACDHKQQPPRFNGPKQVSSQVSGHAARAERHGQKTCHKCGAVRVDSQLGAESTPAEYVANVVDAMREVWRVLRDDGTLWLVLGDSYCSTDKWGGGRNGNTGKRTVAATGEVPSWTVRARKPPVVGLKPKDLVGVPWMVAFALREDGWYLRSDIIWAKKNCMPESVQDRPTRSHEYVFLLSKATRYYYDTGAIREANVFEGQPARSERGVLPGRNKRSVWHASMEPFTGAHFAVFPSAIITPCILAGTSARGVCLACGAPWIRVTERVATPPREGEYQGKQISTDPQAAQRRSAGSLRAWRKAGMPHDNPIPSPTTAGWAPTCGCEAGEPVPAVVLDPFVGSGTTVATAGSLGRRGIGLDLSLQYLQLAQGRTERVQLPILELAPGMMIGGELA